MLFIGVRVCDRRPDRELRVRTAYIASVVKEHRPCGRRFGQFAHSCGNCGPSSL
jgi:hypothetical protein